VARSFFISTSFWPPQLGVITTIIGSYATERGTPREFQLSASAFSSATRHHEPVDRAGFGWRRLFYAAAATLAIFLLLNLVWLKETPLAIGFPEPPANPANLFKSDGEKAVPHPALSPGDIRAWTACSGWYARFPAASAFCAELPWSPVCGIRRSRRSRRRHGSAMR
jgi:hypothetical protein